MLNIKFNNMYNKTLKTLILALTGSFLMSSCIGSFSLFNKVLSWNKDATGNKFLDELIFLVISPAYAVCGMADLFILNTIEFWTGDNPIASNVGKTQDVMGSDGRMYAVKNLKNGYEIKDDKGETVNFTFDKSTKTWSFEKDGETVKLLRLKDKNTAQIYLQDGRTMDVTLDNQGLYEARMAVNNGVFFAAR